MDIIVPQEQSFTFSPEDLPTLTQILGHYNIRGHYIDHEHCTCTLPRPYVGRITLPSRTISIKPAQRGVSLRHVIRLYFFVYNNRKKASVFNDLYDLDKSHFEMDIAHAYSEELKNIVRKGLSSKYREKDVLSNYVVGKIDFIKTYYNLKAGATTPISSVSDDITLETPMNIILAAALWKIKNQIDMGDFIFLAGKLPWARSGNLDFLINNVCFDRNTEFCRRAFDMAIMILREVYYSELGGKSRSESFLINYDILFEDFIAVILLNLSKTTGFSQWEEDRKYGAFFEDGRSRDKNYKPDILYRFERKTTTAYGVLDAKNKMPDVFQNPDVYQMLFYSNILKTQRSILIYPSTYDRESVELQVYLEGGMTAKIRAVFINIAASNNEQFAGSVFKFAKSINDALN